jgi:hypothetical protein
MRGVLFNARAKVKETKVRGSSLRDAQGNVHAVSRETPAGQDRLDRVIARPKGPKKSSLPAPLDWIASPLRGSQ